MFGNMSTRREVLSVSAAAGAFELLATEQFAGANAQPGKPTLPSIGGIGHNLPQEAPHAFAEAIVDVAEA